MKVLYPKNVNSVILGEIEEKKCKQRYPGKKRAYESEVEYTDSEVLYLDTIST